MTRSLPVMTDGKQVVFGNDQEGSEQLQGTTRPWTRLRKILSTSTAELDFNFGDLLFWL
jgi:hypothetical protein